MRVKDKGKRTISLAVLGVPLILTWVSMGLCSDGLHDSHADARLPVTTIHFTKKTSIIGITSWRICGPFVVDDRDQRYSPSSEAEMLEKDYLAAAGAKEAPLKLPSGITNVQINFQRDGSEDPHVATSSGVFLNQNQNFPTPRVDSDLLYWGGYHVFKVVYAAAELASSTGQDVVLLAPTNSPIKIWVNDAVQTQTPPGCVGADWNTHVGVKVHLREGRNTVLVKLICFPYRNDLGVWIATVDGAHRYIEEHGGVANVLTQILVSPGLPLKLAPITAIYDEFPGREERYEIRDVAGRIAATGTLAMADAEVNISALPDGLYSLHLAKGALDSGELFFVGDIRQRLEMYSTQCASKAASDLPCEVLPKLTELTGTDGALSRLDKQKLMVLLLAQLEWSLQGISPTKVFPDRAPRMRLISFRSNIDGSIQHYYLHLPPDAQSGQPLPLVIIEPFNMKPVHEFFNDPPTQNYDAMETYARFADRYHLSLIAVFARGMVMPSELAERDVLEAIQDAKTRFRVDDSRVYLTGDCAGGRNAFLMAEDYPETFSAIGTNAAATHESAAVTNSAENSANPLIRLRNLYSMPICLTHGEADFHSPSSQALVLMQEARKVGVRPQLTWLPGNGQFGLIDPVRKSFEFFATVKGHDPAIPHHVALAVTELKHNHAFWIQADQLVTTDTPGYVTADINRRNHLNITSTNIRRVTINTLKLPPHQVGKRSWVIVCNGGQKRRVAPDHSEQIVLNISQDGDSAQSRMKMFAHLNRRN